MSDNVFDIKSWIKRNAVGLIAIVLSIVSVVVTLTYKQPITVDWLGALVGILSLLVMLLLGWNIYTIIDFNRLKDETEKLNRTINNEIDEKIKASRDETTMELMNITRLLIDFKIKQQGDLFVALFKYFKNNNDSLWVQILAREYLLRLLMQLVEEDLFNDELKKHLKAELTDGEIDFFLSEFLTCNEKSKNEQHYLLRELLISLLPEYH